MLGPQFGSQGELFDAAPHTRLGPERAPEGYQAPVTAKRKTKGTLDTSYDPVRSEGHGSSKPVPQPPLSNDEPSDMPGVQRGIKKMVMYPDSTVHALFHDRRTGYNPNSPEWVDSADKRQTGKTALQPRPGFHAGLGMEEVGHISDESTSRNGPSKKSVLVATEHYGNNMFANRAGHGQWVTSKHMRTFGAMDPNDHEAAEAWLKSGTKPSGTVTPPPGKGKKNG